jgi:uncharacterized protein
MRDYIRRLPWQIEFVIILALAFGWMMPATLHSLISLRTARASVTLISDATLWEIIQFELIFLSAITPILYFRGWTFDRLGIRPSLWGCLIGGFLALVAYGMYFQLAALSHHLRLATHGAHVRMRMVGWGYSWSSIVLTCIINSFYEETFVCGYVISVLTERGVRAVSKSTTVTSVRDRNWADANAVKESQSAPAQATRLIVAVIISLTIRVSYHLYQGISGLTAIIPMGLLFAIWFARTRQLWPLIVAHALFDFVGLAARAG